MRHKSKFRTSNEQINHKPVAYQKDILTQRCLRRVYVKNTCVVTLMGRWLVVCTVDSVPVTLEIWANTGDPRL